jgi:hypothetical protein
VGIAGKNSLFKKLYQDPGIKQKYLSEIQYNLDHIFREDLIFPVIDSTAAHIKEAYNIDPFLGGGAYNIEYQVSELKEYISNRIIYLREHTP